MPPAYVKPYVKRGKTDAADAEAIREAVTRPTMRFVAVKTVEQQSVLMLHKVRDLLVRQRTMLINALRGHLAEFGIIAAKGPSGVKTVMKAYHEIKETLPEAAEQALRALVEQLDRLTAEFEQIEARILAWHRQSDVSRRLATSPGIGPISASAIAASRWPIRPLGSFGHCSFATRAIGRKRPDHRVVSNDRLSSSGGMRGC
jgi:transposase